MEILIFLQMPGDYQYNVYHNETTFKKQGGVMAGLNKVQIIGYLGRDPEMAATPKGTNVSRFSIAVSRRWKNAEGETKETTDWFNVEAWGGLANICQEYLSKGSLVYVEGRLKTDRYEYEGETRYFTKVIARQMQMLDRKPEEAKAPPEEGDEAEE